jgi:hypothetical protein
MKPKLRSPLCLVLCMVLALSACGDGDDKKARAGDGTALDSLPQPERTSGSVTGMPDAPGPGQVGPAAMELPPDTPIASDGSVALPADVLVDDAGVSLPAPGSEGEPAPEDAVALVRDYYAAINGGDFGRAHALWADSGNASGQSQQQFANGFTDTTGVSVQIKEPGRIDAAAGSRYIEVPVAIDAKQRDGSVRQYVGAYVLRRAVVDGASPEQRQWRIASADLREVRP